MVHIITPPTVFAQFHELFVLLCMNNPFDYVPDPRCDEAFGRLLLHIGKLKRSARAADISFCRELEAGKMLGVLIAADASGAYHRLYAFSGQIGADGFHRPGFVGPVFDYLAPDGYFKTREAIISRLSRRIDIWGRSALAAAKSEFESRKASADAEVAACKERFLASKSAREARRAAGGCIEAELQAMIKESQFEKAELHRLRRRCAAELEPYASRLDAGRRHLEEMKEERRAASDALQKWLFDNFTVMNACGESRSLSDIFAGTSFRVPPSGAGECCAPKLLQAAYVHGWQPVAMAEYWYGMPKEGEVRIHGKHYPACRGKCLPVLGWMLQGLDIEPPLHSDSFVTATAAPEILYQNRWFCVVNKPSGMLSVPGRSAAPSVQEWLEERCGSGVRMAHRLDQDTSGLLIATFDNSAYAAIQRLFALRLVHKTYVAILDGDYVQLGKQKEGLVELPLSPDWLDRPRQRVDLVAGKEAATRYAFIACADGRSRIAFHPLTGRTHQLRVHAAAGLGMPIAGDRLYGTGRKVPRLMLHAQKIEFTFPLDGHRYTFQSPSPF